MQAAQRGLYCRWDCDPFHSAWGQVQEHYTSWGTNPSEEQDLDKHPPPQIHFHWERLQRDSDHAEQRVEKPCGVEGSVHIERFHLENHDGYIQTCQCRSDHARACERTRKGWGMIGRHWCDNTLDNGQLAALTLMFHTANNKQCNLFSVSVSVFLSCLLPWMYTHNCSRPQCQSWS